MRWRLAIVTTASLLSNSVVGQVPIPYTISFTQGQAACQIVHFPEPWITEPLPRMDDPTMAALLKALYVEEPVFRRAPDSGPGEVFVSVEALEDRKSPHKFLLSLDPSPSIQKIREDQWNSAAPARIAWAQWDKLQNPGLRMVTEASRLAASMTEVFSAVSPDAAWAAVFRWHGQVGLGEKGVPSKQLFPAAGPAKTEFSVEIADAATEHKVVILSGQFTGVSTMDLKNSLGWVTNRIFWMPLDNDTRDVLVCDSARFSR
jgi:hypothetical protein